MLNPNPIGVFDSGYGGLTILKELKKQLPAYDFIYLGDNARAPYGTRSFNTVYKFTLQNVNELFARGCNLIILACNTASAKALRTIQKNDLPEINSEKRVLGIIRPTAEVIGQYTLNKQIGILGTQGTVNSESYILEIHKFFPDIKVYQQACPMWVPLVENFEHESNGADYFVKKYLDELFKQSSSIDCILLACTHYPLLLKKIKQYLPAGVQIVTQETLVANSLQDYLQRHITLEKLCSKNNKTQYLTTENLQLFNKQASLFLGEEIIAEEIILHNL
ncbi:MAG: glutamate racemase [Bacteroidia bacterium]|nr:glutamate racemase [Bacteroidia bacterium]